MKKKLLVPLILFLSITIAFLVQLKRNAQGADHRHPDLHVWRLRVCPGSGR